MTEKKNWIRSGLYFLVFALAIATVFALPYGKLTPKVFAGTYDATPEPDGDIPPIIFLSGDEADAAEENAKDDSSKLVCAVFRVNGHGTHFVQLPEDCQGKTDYEILCDDGSGNYTSANVSAPTLVKEWELQAEFELHGTCVVVAS